MRSKRTNKRGNKTKGLTVKEILERESLTNDSGSSYDEEITEEYRKEDISEDENNEEYEDEDINISDDEEYEELNSSADEEYTEAPEDTEYMDDISETDEEYDIQDDFSEDDEDDYSDSDEYSDDEELTNIPDNGHKSSKTNKKPSDKKSKNGKIGTMVLIAAVIFVILCFALYMAIAFGYYKNRFLKGTIIDGKDVSDIKAEEYISSLENRAAEYTLTVMNKDEVTDTIIGSDIELKISDEGKEKIKDICSSQNKIMWPEGFLGDKYEYDTDKLVDWNADALNSIVMTSRGYNLPQTIQSEAASLKYKDGKYQVASPTSGDKIDKEAYSARVEEYIGVLKDEMVIQNADVYEKAENAETDEQAMNKACDTANRIIEGCKISIKMGDSNEDITADVMNGIITIDDKYNVTLNESTINSYVEGLGKKYRNMGMTRTFRTAHGTDVQVKGGDYGCSINTKNLSKEINSAIFSKKPLNTTVKLTKNVLSGTGADIGKTYIEVDLTNQYLYMFVDGKKVKECPVVTGLPGKRATPQGTYMLKNKMMDVPLVGDNYVTPVKYWMPFNGGIGLHDAVWQSSFGGELYKSRGSHGCVNLMMKDAGDIYKYAVVKMPVVCYYHSRIASFQPIASSGPVQGTYRPLNDKELKMRAELLSGKKVTDSSAVRDSNEGQAAQTQAPAEKTAPASATATDNNTAASESGDNNNNAAVDNDNSDNANASANTGAVSENKDTPPQNTENAAPPVENQGEPRVGNTAVPSAPSSDTGNVSDSGGGDAPAPDNSGSGSGDVIKEIVVDPIE